MLNEILHNINFMYVRFQTDMFYYKLLMYDNAII